MSKFDLLYNNLMESMVAGGAVGVSDDKAYAYGDTRMPHSTFDKVQKRPNLNRKKKKKS